MRQNEKNRHKNRLCKRALRKPSLFNVVAFVRFSKQQRPKNVLPSCGRKRPETNVQKPGGIGTEGI